MSIRTRPVLLVVHNDTQLVRQIAKMTSELADLMVARDSTRANSLAESYPVSAVVVGRSADGVSPLDILGNIRARRPQARGILLGDASDLSASIEALHSGVVDHVINPPLRERELIAILSLPTPRPVPTPSVNVKPPAARPV